jgi:hypothetical protein
MKDLYDISVLSPTSDFKGDNHLHAIAATFTRRKHGNPFRVAGCANLIQIVTRR